MLFAVRNRLHRVLPSTVTANPRTFMALDAGIFVVVGLIGGIPAMLGYLALEAVALGALYAFTR